MSTSKIRKLLEGKSPRSVILEDERKIQEQEDISTIKFPETTLGSDFYDQVYGFIMVERNLLAKVDELAARLVDGVNVLIGLSKLVFEKGSDYYGEDFVVQKGYFDRVRKLVDESTLTDELRDGLETLIKEIDTEIEKLKKEYKSKHETK